MPISVLSGNSTKILGTGAYTYDASQNLMVYSNRSLHVDAGEPNSYYISGNTFSDLTGRGINGTLTNSFSGTNPTFSQFNGGYFNFNGFKTTIISNPDQNGNSFIEFNADQLPTGSATSSIITWARCSGYSRANRYIFSYGNPGSDQARYLGVTTITGKFLVGGWGPGSELVSNASVSLGEWFQLTFVYTGSSILIYVNGVLDNSKTHILSTVTTNKKARIGRQITTNGASVANADGYWYGDISEVIVYDRVLDAQEIYQDYKVKRYRYNLPEVERPTITPTIPTITTDAFSNVTLSSATVTFTITNTGYSDILDSGVVYSFVSNPTISGTKTTGGSTNLTGLSTGTLYYVRAYATNQQGTGYGNELSFTTVGIVIPTIIAVTASFTGTTADATGNITNLGNAASVSARGFIWNTSTIPTNTVVTTYPRKVINTGSYGTGQFTIQITGLLPNTIYYVRAFASNSAGTKLSNEELVFRTYTFATVTVGTINTITNTDAIVPITTSGQLISAQGAVWKTNTITPNTLNDHPNTEILLDPPNSGSSNNTTIGELIAGTTYYVWGWVQNIAGIAYSATYTTITTDNIPSVTTNLVTNLLDTTATFNGVQNLTNGSPVTERGFIWGDSSIEDIDLTVDNFTGKVNNTLSGGFQNEAFSNSVTGLLPLTSYNVKAYAINSVGVGYGSVIPLSTYGNAIITTDFSQQDVANPSTAQFLYGILGSRGGYSSVEVGFYWGTTNNPTTKIIVNPTQTSTGQIGIRLTGLTPGTTYYFRAYAINPIGEQVGIVKSFATPASITPTLSSLSYNSYVVTSNGPSNLSGEIRFDMTVTNGTNFIPGIEQSLSPIFSSVEFSSDGNIISSSPATVTVPGFGDFATIALPNEFRYYRGYVRNADSSIKLYTPNPVRSVQFEDIRLTSFTYDPIDDRFIAVIQFNATSGRIMTSIGVGSRKDSIDPASSPFNYLNQNAATNVSTTNNYTVIIPASGYPLGGTILSGETLMARAYVTMTGGPRQFSYNLGSVTKP